LGIALCRRKGIVVSTATVESSLRRLIPSQPTRDSAIKSLKAEESGSRKAGRSACKILFSWWASWHARAHFATASVQQRSKSPDCNSPSQRLMQGTVSDLLFMRSGFRSKSDTFEIGNERIGPLLLSSRRHESPTAAALTQNAPPFWIIVTTKSVARLGSVSNLSR